MLVVSRRSTGVAIIHIAVVYDCRPSFGGRLGLFGIDVGGLRARRDPNRPTMDPDEAQTTPRGRPAILNYSHMDYPAVFKDVFYFLSRHPLPPEGPGEGPDCHFPMEIANFGPISARIRGVI